MTKKEKLIWAAGFIDADGTVTIRRQIRNNKYYHAPQIGCGQSLKNGKREAIGLLQELFGGSIHTYKMKGNKLDVNQWTITSKNAYKCAKRLLKYLVVRKKQAQILIEFYEMVIANNHKWMTDEDRLKRDKYFYKTRELNFRGKVRLQRLSEKASKDEAIV